MEPEAQVVADTQVELRASSDNQYQGDGYFAVSGSGYEGPLTLGRRSSTAHLERIRHASLPVIDRLRQSPNSPHVLRNSFSDVVPHDSSVASLRSPFRSLPSLLQHDAPTLDVPDTLPTEATDSARKSDTLRDALDDHISGVCATVSGSSSLARDISDGTALPPSIKATIGDEAPHSEISVPPTLTSGPREYLPRAEHTNAAGQDDETTFAAEPGIAFAAYPAAVNVGLIRSPLLHDVREVDVAATTDTVKTNRKLENVSSEDRSRDLAERSASLLFENVNQDVGYP